MKKVKRMDRKMNLITPGRNRGTRGETELEEEQSVT